MQESRESKTYKSKPFRVVILGAGFSATAGLPLASGLWKEVRHRAENMTGRAGQFREDLEEYISYRKKCYGKQLNRDDVNFEDFMAFLDVEFYLGLRGSDTWSSDGNETQVVVKTLIGQILTERMPRQIPDVYLRFAEALQPDDLVLTFNYDILLERSLEKIGKAYRLFPSRYLDAGWGMATVDHSRDEVIVLKPHGSVDWFSRAEYRALEERRIAQGFKTPQRHLVFGPNSDLRVTPLVDGPRFPNDPLSEIYRVVDIERLYNKPLLFLATPVLLNPSSAKIVYASKLKGFWDGLGRVGSLNFGFAVIGFSLPPEDEYARQVIYRLATNYQENNWGEDVLEHRKTPLLMVDLRTSPEQVAEYERRYAFIDWSRAQKHFGGLTEEMVRVFRGE
jgi:hypothetical protein